MKILTVEDDNIIREGISEYLSEFGYTVIQAKDGREALSEFNSDINLVILDIQSSPPSALCGSWNPRS